MPFGYVAATIGIVPIAWLVALRAAGRAPGSAWWWMAAGFGVSFVADVLSLVIPHPVVSQVYPTAQAALFFLVLVPRGLAIRLVAFLAFVSALSLGMRQGLGLDMALHVAAWGGIAVVADATLLPGRLRQTLVVGFAAMVIAWTAFWAVPGWWTWGVLQAVRAGTALWWCAAAWQGTPATLRPARTAA